jgi:hypothetical protein
MTRKIPPKNLHVQACFFARSSGVFRADFWGFNARAFERFSYVPFSLYSFAFPPHFYCMKRFGIFIAIILGLFLIVAVVAFIFLDSIVQKGVEKVGPAITKVEVKLKDADLSPFSGSGELKGFVVGNPPGYKTPSAINVGSVAIKVDPNSILKDKLVVHSVKVIAPEITFEAGEGGNNLSKILENVQGTEEKPSATKDEEKAKAKKLQVDDFLISGGKVTVSASMLGGKAASVPLPEIHLTSLGQGPEGITPAELTKKVLSAVLDGTLKSVGGEMGKEFTESAKQLGTGTVNQATEKLKGVGDLFKKKQ